MNGSSISLRRGPIFYTVSSVKRLTTDYVTRTAARLYVKTKSHHFEHWISAFSDLLTQPALFSQHNKFLEPHIKLRQENGITSGINAFLGNITGCGEKHAFSSRGHQDKCYHNRFNCNCRRYCRMQSGSFFSAKRCSECIDKAK